VSESLLALAFELEQRGEPFALATVVRCERPTSAKPGARALIRADGTVTGWVGGACAEPVVLREALAALADGEPRLVGLAGDGGGGPGRTEGILAYPMTCHSGGTLEIYVEPYLPKPVLLLVGHGPVVETLARLGGAAGYAVTLLPEAPGMDRLPAQALARRSSVVIATHGDDDEDALARALASDAGYVSLVASRRRAGAILDRLRQRGVPGDRLGRLKAPAGLDIGAVEPAENAVSILAEIVQHHRSGKRAAAEDRLVPSPASPAEARDPVCGMSVDVATARHRSEAAGRLVYFCCGGCKEAFDHDTERYLAGLDR
jgi:xanthine dehydrogenase accessory factor